jgi:hypothetical protein
MTARLRGALLGALALTTLSTLAACQSSKSADAQAGASVTASAASAPSSQAAAPGQAGGGTSESDGLGHPANICQLMPAATVAKLTGEPITVAKEDDTLSYKTYVCDYTSSDGTTGLRITVLADDAAPGYDAGVQAAGSAGKPIKGLGDKAFSSILGLQALYGNVSITVSDLPSDEASATLIRALQPKL